MPPMPPEVEACLRDALGYLNFSSGVSDPAFLRAIDLLFQHVASENGSQSGGASHAELVGRMLLEAADRFASSDDSPLSDAVQARAAIRITFEQLLPAYLEFHKDLLFHQSADRLFNSLFVGRAVEAVLSQGAPWSQTERIVAGALAQLNDYIGYRPVPVLETEQKIEPYPHERLRPTPLYIAGAGAASGDYHDVAALALEILKGADPELLRQAWFDFDLLEELSVDPRAYDFDHPAQRRPNHYFGQWDLHHIDNRGFYRRYVVQQATLDALCGRWFESRTNRQEMLFEAAAVLAGTILMGSGTTGNAPDAHDSSVTLAVLLPHIAAYRDAFYEQLIHQVGGEHARRLSAEATRLKQPFGGARQDLNARLSRLRATQLEQVHLAQVFARMGYPDHASEQISSVDAASARMLCDMHCRLTRIELTADAAAASGKTLSAEAIDDAARQLLDVEEILLRGIDCGAIIDPWNVLGFDCQFSLWQSLENSIHDHRADALIELVDRMFGLYVRLVGEAAAADYDSQRQSLLDALDNLASWWDQYATDTVDAVESVLGDEAFESAEQVGAALAGWREQGAASGDLGFWRQHVDEFRSPKTFGRVAAALLAKKDFVAAMALLVQWVANADEAPLEDAEDSFHAMATRWLGELLDGDRPDRYSLAIKWLDYLEANAESYWEAPRLDLLGIESLLASPTEEAMEDEALELEDDDEEDDDDLFQAAYEGVVYRDSTADGFEGDVFDAGGADGPTDYELEAESRRVGERLAFLSTVADVWKTIARRISGQGPIEPNHRDSLRRFRDRAQENRRQLLELIGQIHRYRITVDSSAYDSMVEYDRRRTIKEMLIDRVISTLIDVQDAELFLAAATEATDQTPDPLDDLPAALAAVVRDALRGEGDAVRKAWPGILTALRRRPILYVPLARGGDPTKVAAARALQQTLHHLLSWLPRIGLLIEAYQLIDAIREMEVSHPVGAGAVTEFDRMFETAYKAMVDAAIISSREWHKGAPLEADAQLIDVLQQLTEPMLAKWLTHSQTLRLSVLERIDDEKSWNRLKEFIQRYGGELFTQYFLNMGNLRAILHQGVENWLVRMQDEPAAGPPLRLIEELDGSLSKSEATRHLSVILEAIVDHYLEYRDYNSTTTQSDRGEMLYTLLAFLRLSAEYERTNWNLRPVAMAHERLVRHDRGDAAAIWRRALAERTSDVADRLVKQLGRLQKKYGMRLPTVADRISERFIRPLLTDRAVALVRPAMQQVNDGEPQKSIVQLKQETDELTQEPTGAGLDVPDWLAALEEEVDAALAQHQLGRPVDADEAPIPQQGISIESMQEQLDRMNRR